MVELPGGSIVAAGRVDKTGPLPGKSFGWLVKVDKDGCMDTISCGLTGVEEPAEQSMGIVVFPNPASDKVTFKLNKQLEKGESALLQISNATGQVIAVHQFAASQDLTFNWLTPALPPGIYFYRLTAPGKTNMAGKLIIQH